MLTKFNQVDEILDVSFSVGFALGPTDSLHRVAACTCGAGASMAVVPQRRLSRASLPTGGVLPDCSSRSACAVLALVSSLHLFQSLGTCTIPPSFRPFKPEGRCNFEGWWAGSFHNSTRAPRPGGGRTPALHTYHSSTRRRQLHDSTCYRWPRHRPAD